MIYVVMRGTKEVFMTINKRYYVKVAATAKNLNNISTVVSFMGQKFTGKLAKEAWFLSQVYHRQPWDIMLKRIGD